MAVSSIRTLLIEDNPVDAKLIQGVLSQAPEAAFELEWVDGLAKGLKELNAGVVDLVLLDLHLPESRGVDTFNTTRACAPAVPIVVLTALDDQELALKVVRDGAQDYLVKGQIDRHPCCARCSTPWSGTACSMKRKARLGGIALRIYTTGRVSSFWVNNSCALRTNTNTG